MVTDCFAAVILQLVITLRSGLWREKVWTGRERTIKQGESRAGEWLPCITVLNLILELQILESNAMCERARIEVEPENVRPGIIFVAVTWKLEAK